MSDSDAPKPVQDAPAKNKETRQGADAQDRLNAQAQKNLDASRDDVDKGKALSGTKGMGHDSGRNTATRDGDKADKGTGKHRGDGKGDAASASGSDRATHPVRDGHSDSRHATLDGPKVGGETVQQMLFRLRGSIGDSAKAIVPAAAQENKTSSVPTDQVRGNPIRALMTIETGTFHPATDNNATEVAGVLGKSLKEALKEGAKTGLKTLNAPLAVEEGIRGGLKTLAKETASWLWDKLKSDMADTKIVGPLVANYPAAVLDGLADKFGVDRRQNEKNPLFNDRGGIYKAGYAVADGLQAQLSNEDFANIGRCMRDPVQRKALEVQLATRMTVELLARSSQYSSTLKKREN